MSNARYAFIVLAGLLAGGAAACGAGAPARAGSVAAGIQLAVLIAQLSLYLPEEATRGMYRGFGGRGDAAASGAESAGCERRMRQGAAGGRSAVPQLQFTRDPKLFLTKEQITGSCRSFLAAGESRFPRRPRRSRCRPTSTRFSRKRRRRSRRSSRRRCRSASRSSGSGWPRRTGPRGDRAAGTERRRGAAPAAGRAARRRRRCCSGGSGSWTPSSRSCRIG